jgi:two-component system, NtrC family, nitrogen regulation sensor histidine kinase NtrY
MSGVLARVVLLGALCASILLLLAQTQYYATTLVLAGIAALVGTGLARRLSGFTRSNHVDEVDSRRDRMAAAVARDLDHANALLDTVPAALFVLEQDHLAFMNRAARELARETPATLAEISALGPAAAHLASMRPGSRQIMSLADGSQAFVSCSSYSAPGAPARRLLALQRIAGDLDAVEARAWGDMARVLAHEMMNSLTPIASLSESLEQLLQTRTGEDEVVAALEVIRRRSHGLMNFVERYRAVAELPMASPRAVAVKPFLDGIERLMSTTFRERRISFATRIAPREVVAHADAELLEQAVINLLRNAVEAVDGAASPSIEIRCHQTPVDLAIEVHDNGRGLSEDDAAKVLTPFFSTKAGGGGIGLSVARHVALAHGGQLRVRRGDVGGAVFSLVLPAA